MYKLQPTGARGWAKIGPLLEVIFHSISNFVFSPSLWSSIPTVILCLLHVFNVYLRFLCRWCNSSAFSAREVDTVYAGVCCAENRNTSSNKWSSSRQQFHKVCFCSSPCWFRFITVTSPFRTRSGKHARGAQTEDKGFPRRNAGVIPSGHFWCSNISSSDICCTSCFTCWSCSFQQRY